MNESNAKKFFYYFSLPIACFLMVLCVLFFLHLTVYAGLILATVLIGTWKRHDFKRSFNRSTVILFLVFILLYPNVLLWPSQIQRRLPGGRQKLIEPTHPVMSELNASFFIWHDQYYGFPFNEQGSLAAEVRAVDQFVRSNLTEYEFDYTNPYHLEDHLPTISEIIESDFDGDGKWEDDCDGQTLLTVSLLIFMGYINCFISEIEFHWHTIVFPVGVNPKTPEGWDEGILLYASEPKRSFYVFNQTDLFIPPTRPWYISVLDLITGTYIIRHLGYLVLDNRYLDASIPFAVWLLIFFAAAAIVMVPLSLLVGMFQWKKPGTKQAIKAFLLAGACFMIGIILCLLFFYLDSRSLWQMNFEWTALGNLTLFLTLGFSLRIIDKKVFTGISSYPEKSIRKA